MVIPLSDLNIQMKEKVIIIIKRGKYCPSVKNGQDFTSVGYMAKRYGGSGPCDTNQEIGQSIKNAIKCIVKEGDKPLIQDLRIKQETLD